MNFLKHNKMQFNFSNYLKSKGFKRTNYNGTVTHEFEREDKKMPEADKTYFCVTINPNGLMTSARSDQKGLYNEDAVLPDSKQKAGVFLKKFLK